MQIAVVDVSDDIARVILTGKLDMAGANDIAEPLTRVSGEKRGLIVDLSKVSFLSSMGIRQLVAAARTLTRKGGRLVLLKPTKLVEEVLTLAVVNDLIPIARSDQDADAVLRAALQD